MPKIVVQGYQADGYVATGAGDNKTANEAANLEKLKTWFDIPANWEKLSEQLTKKLGSDKFKNVVLTAPTVSYEEVTVNSNTWKNPKVTFNIQAKPGYQLTQPTTDPKQISLTIRVLYENQTSTQNLLTIQGASPSAAPKNTKTPNDAEVIKNVNVYLNYTGPAIVLDQAVPAVGTATNTSLNGTSNVTGDFNNAFRGNPSSGLLFTNRYPNPLLKSVINYVNKFDPKFRAEFVTNATNGVAIASVQNNTQLKIGSLNDFLWNNKGFLQQVNTDTKAVYFAVIGVASNRWLNTFLIRIPLTKFVKPLTEFQAQSPTAPTQEASGDQVQADPQATQMGTQAQS
ncbi:hemagglutinin [Mycoplasmopsis synoviae]|uniref:hemagglutinin n=1 Tax=Mycoplasmopsis synoviae TaxID=2109 RepID=UPI002264ED52|nr:hemagglutinin [Mycoplasmopsis synoviae]UZW64008.1 hemagglutinin [Mycoplasmopsis synoviae]